MLKNSLKLKRKNDQLLIVVLSLFLFSCGQKQNKTNNQIAKTDTTHKTVIIESKDTIPQYLSLIPYFGKENGKVPSNRTMPFSVLTNFIASVISDTALYVYSDCNPVDRFENKHGNFFLIRVNCTSGADCAMYYLLTFNSTGKFDSITKLGDLAVEENTSLRFNYKLTSDTMLVTYQIDYDNEKGKGIDSLVNNIKLIPGQVYSKSFLNK